MKLQAYKVLFALDGVEIRRYAGSLGYQIWTDGAFRYFSIDYPRWAVQP